MDRPEPVRSRSRSPAREAALRGLLRDRETQLNAREELLNRRERQLEKEESDVRKARTLHLEAVKRWDAYMEARERDLRRRREAQDCPPSPATTEPGLPVDDVGSDPESEHSAQRPNW